MTPKITTAIATIMPKIATLEITSTFLPQAAMRSGSLKKVADSSM